MRPLSPAQIAMLHRLVDEGPFRPKGAQWATVYTLEAAKLAFKRDFLIYITDAGRLKVAQE